MVVLGTLWVQHGYRTVLLIITSFIQFPHILINTRFTAGAFPLLVPPPVLMLWDHPQVTLSRHSRTREITLITFPLLQPNYR